MVIIGQPKFAGDVARELLDSFVAPPVAVEGADAAARLRRTERWHGALARSVGTERRKASQTIQAAMALEENPTLVTRTTKNFQDGDPVPAGTPYRS